MSEKKDSRKLSIAVDTGVLIEYLEDSTLGKAFYKEGWERDQFKKYYVSPLVDMELKYIFCRRIGFQEARTRISKFLRDFVICPENQLRDEAFRLKCDFPISIADCYSLAVGKVYEIPVYMKKEREIDDIIDDLSAIVEILFIDDLI